ncbi:restriction endonuclease subunit S [Mesorhizobium sp. VK22B]|uniref:Restriction endonuclease subunit S n=1 Tax=Mesorhizobium captivum TaxID=3072319 RepID=A0ABU4Z604_9HYPH|nr:restriction endonuclease subunit S [Mesorhizobium sp. VK22B]MDX8494641.1 restriction endonuclease subunit S [Mesorhizobium sp. VK22B]
MTVSVASLVSDNLDSWTTAVERKSGAGRGGGKRASLYGIDRLRALILDLAVRGKLVPQELDDEPVAELLKRIKKAKAQRVHAGELRRPRELDNGSELVAPFSIPDTWQWVRLDEVGAIVGGGTPPTGSASNFLDGGKGVPWLTPADLGGYKGRYISHGERDLTEKALGASSATIMPAGSVLFTSRAPIGYVVIAANPISTNQGFKSIVPYIPECSLFIATAMKSFAKAIHDKAPGTTFKEVSGKMVAALSFPLPPLAEQRRIVAKVDELMALCDALEAESSAAMAAHQALVEALLATLRDSAVAADLAVNWARLETHFDTLFTTEASVDALKQTIFELAVRGKLVLQDSSEESAAKLIQKIGAEKARLVTANRLRKEKPISPIDPKELPFAVPLGWAWAKIGEVALSTQYGTSENAIAAGAGVPVLAMGNINNGIVDHNSKKLLPATSNELPELFLEPGDLLYNRTNSYELVGKTGLFNGPRHALTFASYLIRIRLIHQHILPTYLNLVMNSPYFRSTQVVPRITKQTGQANVSGSAMRNMLVPIPPFAEQCRIMSRVHELVSLCGALSAHFSEASQTKKRLADLIAQRAAA